MALERENPAHLNPWVPVCGFKWGVYGTGGKSESILSRQNRKYTAYGWTRHMVKIHGLGRYFGLYLTPSVAEKV